MKQKTSLFAKPKNSYEPKMTFAEKLVYLKNLDYRYDPDTGQVQLPSGKFAKLTTGKRPYGSYETVGVSIHFRLDLLCYYLKTGNVVEELYQLDSDNANLKWENLALLKPEDFGKTYKNKGVFDPNSY